MRVTIWRQRSSVSPRFRVSARGLSSLLIVVLATAWLTVAPRAAASPGPVLRIVDAAGNTPVVNEGGRVALRVVDGSGNPVSASSWSSDNKTVGKVKRTNGLLRGRSFGFATVTAQTSQGPVSGFVVCARLRRQNGAMTQGDTKTDTGGNVYLSSPVRHVLYKATAASADVFAGQTDVSGYQDGTGGGVRFNGPAGIGVDNRAEGGLYVADSANHCIRKIDFRSRSSLAAGTPGFEGTMYGDENPISEAMFTNPRGVASVGANLYVTDTGNHCVWYVDVQRQRVQLVAGEPGEAGNTNGEGRAARFNSPSGITVNTRGNLLAVADTGNNVVRLIAIVPRGDGDGVIGQVTTLGLGSSARNARILEKLDSDRGTDQIAFDAPVSVSFDGVDNVYVIDRQTASVVTRPSAASGRPVEQVDLAQVGTLGDPASVTVRRTQAFVLDEAATSDTTAVNVVEVGAPTITTVTPDTARLEGGQRVTITGTNFAPESKLTLGDAEVTSYTVRSSTRIRFVVPPQRAPGRRTLTVITRGGVAQREFGVQSAPLSELAAGEITTIAGGIAYVGDGNPPLSASLAFPEGVVVDASGDVLIADSGNNRVRKVDAQTGIVTTIAGTGESFSGGDGGPSSSASLYTPEAVAADGAGNVYVGQTGGKRVSKVDANTGLITTIAGNGEGGFSGDGGPAASARLGAARGVAVDADGNVLIADSSNNRVRQVDARTGIITTIAGTGEEGFGGDGGPATSAKLWNPVGVAIDGTGGILVAEFSGNRIRRIDRLNGTIATVAGTGEQGFGGDGGPAAGAKLFGPWAVAIDGTGNLLIADSNNLRIRRVDVQTGIISTVAGNGEFDFGGDGGPATSAKLAGTYGVAVDAIGDVLIADTFNHRIRIVDAATGTISTAVGTGEMTFRGDGGPATFAKLNVPHGVSADENGNVLIADTLNHRIREVSMQTGIIATIAGSGKAGYSGDGGPAEVAGLNFPCGATTDKSGNVLIADTSNNRIRKVDRDTGSITTIAGTGIGGFGGDGGPATSALLFLPHGLVVDGDGNLLIADELNHRIRKVDGQSGIITTIAGTGEYGFGGDGGPATDAKLASPAGLAVDAAGDVLIADKDNHRIRKVDVRNGTVTTIAGNGERGYGGDGGLATSTGLNDPASVAVDGAGNVLITDFSTNRIRRVDAQTGIITTIAGDGVLGYVGDGGPAEDARLDGPNAVSIDRSGNVLISDALNNAIRVVKGVALQAVSLPVPAACRRSVDEIAGGLDGGFRTELSGYLTSSLSTTKAGRLETGRAVLRKHDVLSRWKRSSAEGVDVRSHRGPGIDPRRFRARTDHHRLDHRHGL